MVFGPRWKGRRPKHLRSRRKGSRFSSLRNDPSHFLKESRQLIDSRANLRKTVFSPMNSERQKREEEIEMLVRGAGLRRESDAAFQEEVRKTAAALVKEEVSRIERSERAERRKL